MKTFVKLALLLLTFSLSFGISNAQEKKATTNHYYHVLDYMKVKPGMDSDYLKLEKAWKKLHEANVKAGKYEAWTLDRVLSPYGASTEYNYITRQSFKNEKQLAKYMESGIMIENWEKLLTPDEVKLVNKTASIRDFVKTEVWHASERVMAPDYQDAKIHVFNFFDFPEGKSRADHVKVEKEIWMPIHKARVEAGDMKGWVLLEMQLPFGASMPYHDATVDIYSDWEEYMQPFVGDYFEKVHPGKDMDKLMKMTTESAILTKGEVREMVDKVRKPQEAVARN